MMPPNLYQIQLQELFCILLAKRLKRQKDWRKRHGKLADYLDTQTTLLNALTTAHFNRL